MGHGAVLWVINMAASYRTIDRLPWSVLSSCVDVETVAPYLESKKLLTDEELRVTKEWWSALPRDLAVENFFAKLKEKGPDSLTCLLEAIRTSIEKEQGPATSAHRQLLRFLEEDETQVAMI